MSSSAAFEEPAATLMAGVPSHNFHLYHRIRFLVGDPVAFIQFHAGPAAGSSVLILRDIEMDRAKRHARADKIACPADFTPAAGLSGDRETATAQAAAECLRRSEVYHTVADRSLPFIFAHEIRQTGIDIRCDPELGVLDRRAKDEQEIEWLREAQRVTEQAMERACSIVARSEARQDGILFFEGQPLTSARLRATIDVFLLEQGYSNPTSIVASGPQGADCHESGSGEIRTGQPVILDIFPQNRKTLYNGDCTRTVVHGEIPAEIQRAHAAVVLAKSAAIAATRADVTGEDVHAAATTVIREHGYSLGVPPKGAGEDYCGMIHGTGHGIGLDVHEPPLLDRGGPTLIAGDALTIEPGLYCRAWGGIRVEDLVIVTPDGCENLNSLHEGLTWA